MKRTATIVLGLGALAAWLAGAATSNRALPDPIVPRPAVIDKHGEELASEIARLHEHLRPESTPRAPGRNVFRYHAAPPPLTSLSPVAAPRAALVEAPLPPRPPQIPLRLSGMAEDAGPDGPMRVAIIAGDAQLYMVKVGDPVTPRYRVTAISADAVELTDLTDNTTRRLALK